MIKKIYTKIYFLGLLLITPISSFSQDYSGFYSPVIDTRCRVIITNDFGGDPDGLFQLAHHLLSPSVDIEGIIGSIHYEGGFYGYPGNAVHSAAMANELLSIMKLDSTYKAIEGSNTALKDTISPIISEGAKLIVQEAMRDDVKTPLFVVCGAGLTDLASAYLMEPQIAKRITLVWIGGTEYEGIAWPPPGGSLHWEYNTGIDVKACQVIFNNSNIPIWQVPRDAYRQALTSYSELIYKVKAKGETGEFLVERLEDLMQRANKNLGEAYVLGDSPLVLLTALQSSWEVDPSSSKYTLKPSPIVNDSGIYEDNPNGRTIRVYYDLDIRLMFEDFFAKIAIYNSKH